MNESDKTLLLIVAAFLVPVALINWATPYTYFISDLFQTIGFMSEMVDK